MNPISRAPPLSPYRTHAPTGRGSHRHQEADLVQGPGLHDGGGAFRGLADLLFIIALIGKAETVEKGKTMALKPCRECKKEISTTARTCPHCGKKNPHTSTAKSTLGVVILIIAGWIAYEVYFDESDQEKKARLATETAEEAEDKRKGFHCLSAWDGSHRDLKDHVKKSARDPDSFEHIETKITPVNSDGEHTIFMKYRARNGFGGMSVGQVNTKVSNATCSYTITGVFQD